MSFWDRAVTDMLEDLRAENARLRARNRQLRQLAKRCIVEARMGQTRADTYKAEAYRLEAENRELKWMREGLEK